MSEPTSEADKRMQQVVQIGDVILKISLRERILDRYARRLEITEQFVV